MASTIHLSYTEYLKLNLRQIQRLIFAAEKIHYSNQAFLWEVGKLSHSNADLKKSKFPKYKDPIENTEQFKEAEKEFYRKQFGG